MNFIKIFFSRIIKLLANFSKVLSYLFHFAFPKKRFQLPSASAPLIKIKNKSNVPHVIWQTNFTDRVTLPVYLNYLFNRLISPTYAYRFMITSAREEYVRSNFSEEVLQQYLRLQIGAAQADLWRLLVLYREGGVYLDIDAHAIWPLGYVIGDEMDSLYIETKGKQLSNYFIASAPGNKQIKEIIDQVVFNIESGELTNVFDITGPGVFNKVLDFGSVNRIHYRLACNQGNFTNEYFQYIDKPAGKWTKEQKKVSVVRKG